MTESILLIAEKVVKLLKTEAEILGNVKDEVDSLAKKLKHIGSKLKKADVMTDRKKGKEKVDEWDERVSELRSLAFRAEDVIEVFANNSTPYEGCDVFRLIMGCFYQIITLHKLKNEINDINVKLEKFSDAETSTIDEEVHLGDVPSGTNDGDEMVGFVDVADEVVSLLQREEPRGELGVVTICAEGGAGKTTLSRNIWRIFQNDDESQFECVAWIPVSKKYITENIWQSILDQVPKKKRPGDENEDSQTEKKEVRQMVIDRLNGRNYLIILDDLWRKEDWENINAAFPVSTQMKSRVLLTTRKDNIARHANPVDEPIKLGVLNEEDGLTLFLMKVFRCSSSRAQELRDGLKKPMEGLAKKMVAICEGLPIAIVVLGGILTDKVKDTGAWTDTFERVQSGQENLRGLQKVLALGYNDLSSTLKSCFLYCGLFPKNSLIDCDKLIRLWVAEGFLKLEKGDEEMEDVARKCLEKLSQKSLIKFVEYKSNGDPEKCRTHDLIRGLAKKEAKKAKFSSFPKEWEHLGSKEAASSRRIALHPKDSEFSGGTSTVPLQSTKALSLSDHPPSSPGMRSRVGKRNDDDLVGFEEQADELASLLTEERSLGQLAVVSVDGEPGTGKTALARKVYNRSDVASHFPCRAWVHLNFLPDLKDTLQKILVQVTRRLTYAKLRDKEDEELQTMLYNHLEGKSYLIVLDNLWHQDNWDAIKEVFPLLEGQNCVVLTINATHDAEVDYDGAASTDSFEMRRLDEDLSLKLFLETIFNCLRDEIPEASLSKEMEDVARKIVVECDGIPLSILLLGGMLSFKKKDVSVWSNLLGSLNWGYSKFAVNVVAACYVDLPDNLRRCLSVFTNYLPGIQIECDKLVGAWAEKGLLEPTNNKGMVDVARDWLEELIKRNLINVAEWRSNGDPETCCIPLLLFRFLVREANKPEISQSSENRPPATLHPKDSGQLRGTSTTAPRFHALKTFSLSRLLDPFKFPNSVYSLLCFSKEFGFQQLFPLLRILDLEGVENLVELPIEIGDLNLLRYLSLRGTRVTHIPSWIANLRNLQTLDAPDSRIPIHTLKLNQLRHLFAHSFYITTKRMFCPDSSSPSLCIDVLEHLHTLELDISDREISGLNRLSNLRILRLCGCDDDSVLNVISYLKEAKRLKILRLTQTKVSSPIQLPSLSTHDFLSEIVIEGTITQLPNLHDLPPNLTYLWLEIHINNEVDPMSTLQELKNLKKLCLRLFKDGRGYQMTCSAEGFPELEFLYIGVNFTLENWIVEQRALPKLRALHIEGGEDRIELGELPDGLRYVTTLKELDITQGYDVRLALIGHVEEWEIFEAIRPSFRFFDRRIMWP